MYHPSKYDKHNESLDHFIEEFNKVAQKLGNKLKMEMREEENFIDDGFIVYNENGEKIIFDWEKRFSYYNTYGFPYETFGQFERKIKKEEIELSIQCSKDESAFCFAWHDDFRKEKITYMNSKTGSGGYENNGKRFTKNFVELKYEELDKFHNVLLEKFNNHDI